MNASKFMDKQIMELSASGGQNILDLISPPENHGISENESVTGAKKEEILPNYDFQPIRTAGSADLIPASSNLKDLNYSSSVTHDSYKGSHEMNKDAYDTNILGEFDRTVKKYADKLMHALEGVNSRLSQIEGRTHDLETALNELKLTVSTDSGSSDRMLRQLENILREVQTGVQVLRDKQENSETQIQLAKLQASKVEHYQPDESLHYQTPMPPSQLSLSPPPPSHLSLSPQGLIPSQLPAMPAMPLPPTQPSLPPPPPSQPSLPPQGLIPSQNPSLPAPPSLPSQTQFPSVTAMPPRDSYFFPPNQQESPQQQYHLPPQQQRPPPSQPQQYTQNTPPPQLHHPDESSAYISSAPQIYSPSIHQLSGPGSGPQFPPGYRPQAGPAGSFSQYNSPVKQPQSPFFPSSVTGPGSGYPRLPMAQLLPSQTAPAGTGSSGERVPVDDVVDKVTSMGFPRDVVRSTVRRLTENRQNVDLNVVLDKLMNDGENPQQKTWFVR